jgi:hypothetical protein
MRAVLSTAGASCERISMRRDVGSGSGTKRGRDRGGSMMAVLHLFEMWDVLEVLRSVEK